jgi:hypothetical protein
VVVDSHKYAMCAKFGGTFRHFMSVVN